MGKKLEDTEVTTLNFALAESFDGKWAAVFTAGNMEDPMIGGSKFMSDWFDAQEDAELKMREVCDGFAKMGVKVQPMKRPA